MVWIPDLHPISKHLISFDLELVHYNTVDTICGFISDVNIVIFKSWTSGWEILMTQTAGEGTLACPIIAQYDYAFIVGKFSYTSISDLF